jgi:hypothetical protein
MSFFSVATTRNDMLLSSVVVVCAVSFRETDSRDDAAVPLRFPSSSFGGDVSTDCPQHAFPIVPLKRSSWLSLQRSTLKYLFVACVATVVGGAKDTGCLLRWGENGALHRQQYMNVVRTRVS